MTASQTERPSHPSNGPEIPTSANLAVSGVVVAANIHQFLILPVLLLPMEAAWGWTLAPVVALTNTSWSLAHEAFHSHLLPRRRWNDRLGRLLCVMIGAPFRMLRFGHLLHHRFNRSTLDRAEVMDHPPPASTGETALHYFRILGGLYLVELASSALLLAPRRVTEPLLMDAFGRETEDGRTLRPAAERQLLSPEGYSEMRFDGLCVTVLFVGGAVLYGEFVWMLALAVLGRAFLLSFFDNAYHYGNPLDEPQAAYNLRMPRPLAWAFLHFNLHAAHHRHPSLPWSELPAAFEGDRDKFHSGYLPAALRQLNGPIPEHELPSAKSEMRRQGRTGDAGRSDKDDKLTAPR